MRPDYGKVKATLFCYVYSAISSFWSDAILL